MQSVWMDRFGSAASTACALHCFTMSFAPALLGVLGISFLANEVFEWAFFSAAIAFALLAAALGYRVHRAKGVLIGFAVGVGLLVMGRMAEAFELFEGGGKLAILGGLALAGSHLASLRCTAACRADCDC